MKVEIYKMERGQTGNYKHRRINTARLILIEKGVTL